MRWLGAKCLGDYIEPGESGFQYQSLIQDVLASQGVGVVLTARKGMDATSMLHEVDLDNVVFHQLDVLDPVSIESSANSIKYKIWQA